MQETKLDKKWIFRRGFIDSLQMMDETPGIEVNLPHDGMIGTKVSPDAYALSDSGYFSGDLTHYTKYVNIPKEWEGSCVGLKIDGAMMNATVEVNGGRVAIQHYGYAPFYVDLTNYVTFGEENRISININTSMLINSRWYTGSGLYRGVELCHGPRVHIVNDGIFARTKEVSGGFAFLEFSVEVENATMENRLAEVTVKLTKDGSDKVLGTTKRVIHINGGKIETAHLCMNLENPDLWDAENPNLYCVKAEVRNLGRYTTRLIEEKTQMAEGKIGERHAAGAKDGDGLALDRAETLFGIRTITADSVRGLCINGKTVKLRGGCLHHDNGLLGAVSLYESEARKVRKLKEVGFNAIRTAHNPPSAALIEACDRLGMYVFDEAFDCWGMSKRGGDYAQFFDTDWEKDLTAFVRRDRNHPCVVIWSTGNEIPERGGLDNGYTLATKLASTIKKNDGTRPVSNGICTLWSGLDDKLMKGQNQNQNAADNPDETKWERITEPFTNGLDIVGYNYMEDIYERDHELFPDRVILGSENFAVQIGYRWPLVERLPYVIGDFTWTAWDYIGEAGIGKAVYVDKDDPLVKKGSWSLMPKPGSPFPWRTANDADFDITGFMMPQGCYRSVVWGSKKTHLFSMHPDTFGKVEMMTMWGFPAVQKNWNYKGYEGKKLELVVYSCAEEVEVFVNGKTLGKRAVCMERPMPNSVRFECLYEPGKVEAVSYCGGKEVSRDCLMTTVEPVAIRLVPEKLLMKADGHDLIYVGIEVLDKDGKVVPDAEIELNAEMLGATDNGGCGHQDGGGTADGGSVCQSANGSGRANCADNLENGCAYLAGFGSGNPVTEDNYTDCETKTFRGRALAIVRAGYESGAVSLKVTASGLGSSSVDLKVE